jgi:hypothetical protein
MNAIKASFKKIIPDPILAFWWSHLERRLKRELARGVDAKEIFTKVYESEDWGQSEAHGDKFYSGPGSHSRKMVDCYVSAVHGFLLSLDKKPDAVDLGCGDFAVGSQIRPYCNNYIAADVVEGLINRNKERYAKDSVEFCVLDIVNDELPDGDVVFLRQVLQHLTNSDIEKVVAKLSAKYRFLILTEHLPVSDRFVPNLDKARGRDIRLYIRGKESGVVLTEHPFNLMVKQTTVLCEVFEDFMGRKGMLKSMIRTNLYEL